jgi:hypothetical protein
VRNFFVLLMKPRTPVVSARALLHAAARGIGALRIALMNLFAKPFVDRLLFGAS